MYIYSFLLFILFLSFQGCSWASEVEIEERIQAHLLIKDPHSAFHLAKTALSHYPDSLLLKRIFLRVLNRCGRDEEVLDYLRQWQELHDDHQIIEDVAWGLLLRASNVFSSPAVQAAALQSALTIHDARAVPMILTHLSSSNVMLRLLAIEVTKVYRDAIFIQKLKERLHEEKEWRVRTALIDALGILEVKEVGKELEHRLASEEAFCEEKMAIFRALAAIYPSIECSTLTSMLHAESQSLRQLACHLIAEFDLVDHALELEKLLKDPCASTRIFAINTLSLIGCRYLSQEGREAIHSLMSDIDPAVAVTAAWVAVQFSPEQALFTIEQKLYGPDLTSKRLAAFVLARMGKIGLPLAKKALIEIEDLFIRVNIAAGLIEQRAENLLACQTLFSFLTSHHHYIMWDQQQDNPLITLIMPTQYHHISLIPQYPMLMDQIVRLHLLGRLAIVDFPQAEEALKHFLTHTTFGVSAMASSILVREGGKGSRDLLEKLLEDPYPLIRVQAALVLGLMTKVPRAAEVLQHSYQESHKLLQMKVLEVLGHIGNPSSIPFLLHLLLSESHQTLRVLAASALIQCINH